MTFLNVSKDFKKEVDDMYDMAISADLSTDEGKYQFGLTYMYIYSAFRTAAYTSNNRDFLLYLQDMVERLIAKGKAIDLSIDLTTKTK